MKGDRWNGTWLWVCILAAGVLAGGPGLASSHCDTMSGPVIQDARLALDRGDVTPVLKWVRAQDEAEIRDVFARVSAVRRLSSEAAQLADRYFFETLVRVHRSGEGAPFTGLRDEPADPVIAMAEKALADGSADEMIGQLDHHMAEMVREKFARVVGASKSKERSVEAGREYVEAYVIYMHYLEGLNAAIVASDVHHEAAAPTGHGD